VYSAICVSDSHLASDPGQATLDVTRAAPPVIHLGRGTSRVLHIHLPEGMGPDAKVHFTTDGSDPTTSSPVFELGGDEFLPDTTLTVKAITHVPGIAPSGVSQALKRESALAVINTEVRAEVGGASSVVNVDLPNARVEVLKPIVFEAGRNGKLQSKIFLDTGAEQEMDKHNQVVLNQVAAAMKSIARIAGKWGLPIVEFDVEGHTNVAVGDKAKQQSQSTMMISEGRAKAVHAELLKRNVDPNMINVTYYGGIFRKYVTSEEDLNFPPLLVDKFPQLVAWTGRMPAWYEKNQVVVGSKEECKKNQRVDITLANADVIREAASMAQGDDALADDTCPGCDVCGVEDAKGHAADAIMMDDDMKAELFRLLDKDGDGDVEMDEVKAAFENRGLGDFLKKHDIKFRMSNNHELNAMQFMKIFDADNSGRITLGEMMNDMAQLRADIGTVLDMGARAPAE